MSCTLVDQKYFKASTKFNKELVEDHKELDLYAYIYCNDVEREQRSFWRPEEGGKLKLVS